MVLFVNYPSWISPFVFKNLPIRWYAVMYLVAFSVAYLFYTHQFKEDKTLTANKDTAENIFISIIIGLLVGARVGSCLLYDDAVYYLTHPWMVFWPFQNGNFVGLPGMSYHGGVIGGILFGLVYLKKQKLPVMKYFDVITASIPFAYTFGRLGNFFNAELYGRVTTSPLGMMFPYAERFNTGHQWVRDVADQCGLSYEVGSYINLPRWPSQLFEAFFEGIVLGVLVWFVVRKLKAKKNWADGTITGFYFAGYGFFRFIIEYFRQPDADIGYVLTFGGNSDNIHVFQSLGNISKGQILCLMMVIGGAALIALVNILGQRKGK